jgi:16S rRNA (guanine966-N2)-methyltransferase
VAGRYGGRRIATPAGRGTRPTADRVREALFSALGDITGARLADLYAGSGAVGLEAISRGAEHALLVESDPRAARTIRDNIRTLGAQDAAVLVTAPVAPTLGAGPKDGRPYQVVFADPPYETTEDEITAVLQALANHAWLAEGGTVVVERSSRTPEPVWVQGITPERSRRYGETILWYGRVS